jgi:hypothetical protein
MEENRGYHNISSDEKDADAQFLVIITFIKLILLKIRVRNVKFQIYEWQRATGSDAFETRH